MAQNIPLAHWREATFTGERDWNPQPGDDQERVRTRRGGKSWQRKMKREARIREEMKKDQEVSDTERTVAAIQAVDTEKER